MKRQPSKALNRTWYIPRTAAAGAGIEDCYGRVYMVQPSGALKKIKDIETGPGDPRRGRK